MFDPTNDFAGMFDGVLFGSPAKKTGRAGLSHPCKDKRELSEWFRGFADACKDIRPATSA